MKCPNCNFVTSNVHDVCSRCGMDLRPRKRELGIVISNPGADIKELRARAAVQAAKNPSRTADSDSNNGSPAGQNGSNGGAEKKREKSWLSRLFGKTAASAPAAAGENAAVFTAAPAAAFQTAAAPPSKPAIKDPFAAAAESEQIEFKSCLTPAAAAVPEAQPVPAEDEITPDLSLNDFLSELEKFQAIEPDSLEEPESDQPLFEKAESADMADTDGDLPAFDLEETQDLLSGLLFGSGAKSAAGLPGPGLTAAAQADAVEAAPENQYAGTLQAGALETAQAEDAENIAFDQLIGSMAAHPAADEDSDDLDDALFSSAVQNISTGDPLQDFAVSLNENLEDAMAATADLAESGLFGETGAISPAEQDSNVDEFLEPEESAFIQSAANVTPDVMEFDEDDAILEQQLDAMLGDLVLDVTPVKKAKTAKPGKEEEELVFIDDDLEISFEIEDEEAETEQLEPAPEKDLSRSDQILDQLVAAFNQIDSGTEHRSIADAPDDHPAAKTANLDRMLLRLRAAAETGSPNLIDELLEQLAEGYGIDSGVLRQAVAPANLAGDIEQPGAPKSAPAEEESAVRAAAASESMLDRPAASVLPISDLEKSAGPGDADISSLSGELDRELAALLSEGTTIFGEPVSVPPAESGSPAEIVSLEPAGQTLAIEAIEPVEAAFSADLADLSSELDKELAMLEQEGTSLFCAADQAAGCPPITQQAAAPPELDPELAALEQELDAELLLLEAEGTSLIHMDAAATAEAAAPAASENSGQIQTEEEPAAQFAPTQTGAFLISDLAAIESPVPEPVPLPESDIAALQAELSAELEKLAEDGTSIFAEQSAAETVRPEAVECEAGDEAAAALLEADQELTDLTAELDKELALLEAEGLHPARFEEDGSPSRSGAAPAEEDPSEEDIADSISAQELLEPAVDLRAGSDIESAASPAEPLPSPAQIEEPQLLLDEISLEELDELNPETGLSAPGSLQIGESEQENSPTATGIFLAADLEAILGTAAAPAAEVAEEQQELLEAVTLEELNEQSAAAVSVLPETQSDDTSSVVDILLDLSQLNRAGQRTKLSADPGTNADETSGVIPGAGSGEDSIQPSVPFDPEEVSIEPAAQDTLQFSKDSGHPASEPPQLPAGGPGETQFDPEEVSIEPASDESMQFSAESDPSAAGDAPDGLSAEGPGEVPFDPEEVSIEPDSEAAIELSPENAQTSEATPTDRSEEPSPRGPEIETAGLISAAEAVGPQLAEAAAAPVSAGLDAAAVSRRQPVEIREALWDEALIDPDLEMTEVEIDAAELCDARPTPKLTMLFDLAEEEILAPGKQTSYIEAVPTSANRAIIDAGLKRAVKRYETEVHEELVKRPPDRQTDFNSEAALDGLLKVLAPASLVRRTGALFVDLSISSAAAATAAWFIVPGDNLHEKLLSFDLINPETAPFLIAAAGFSWILWTIFNVLPTSESGQTAGQRLFGVAVFDFEGETPGFRQIFTRTMLAIWTLFSCGAGLLPALGRRRQTLHDRLARTVVVRLPQ